MSRHRNRGPRVGFLGQGLVRIKSQYVIDGRAINRVRRTLEGAALQHLALRRAIARARSAVRWSKQDAVESQIVDHEEGGLKWPTNVK